MLKLNFQLLSKSRKPCLFRWALLLLIFLIIHIPSKSFADLSDLNGLDLEELEQFIVSDEQFNRYCSGLTRDWGGFAHIGGAGFACDAKTFGNADIANLIYEPYFVDRSTLVKEAQLSRDEKDPLLEQEKTRYTSKIVGLVETIGREYLKRRRPKESISDKEMEVWIRGNLTRIYQETLFSHYRIGASKELQPTGPRFLVGDPAKGKRMTEFKSMGISQINILAHNDMIAGAAYFDLIQNILEGYDNFYRLWSRARVALLNSSKATGGLVKCAKYIKDYEDVAQSAYSAYTGGGFCRWHFSPIRKNEWEKRTGCRFPLHLSPKDKYKQCESDFRKTQFSLHWNNDLDFSYKFKTQPWAKYVDPKLAKVSVDVNCLFDGNHYCLIPDDKREAYLRSHILVVTSSQQENSEILKYCVLLENNKGASCVKELEMLQCLKSSVNRNQYSGIRPISIDDLNSLSSYIHNYNNKYSLCNNESTGIFSPGSFITPKMALTLRANPWVPANQGKNNYLATVRPEQVFQVLDFVIRPGGDLERWYKIRLKTHKNKTLTGFVYGGVGSLDSKNIWTRYWKKSSLNEYDISEALLPSKGMLFRIKHSVTAKLQLVNMQNPSIATKPKKDSYVSHGLIFHKKDSVLYSIDVIVEENGQYFRFPIGTFQRDDEGPGYENTFHQSISIPKRSEEAL